MFQFLVLSLLTLTVTSADRILGGTDADIKDFPYQVSLHMEFNGTGFFACGASILSKRFIITAQHCLREMEDNQLYIRYGSTRYDSGGHVIYVKETFCYENCNYFDDDIALLYLKEDIEFSDTACPIELPTEPIPDDTLATTSGWGKTNESIEEIPKILQKISLNIINKKVCKRFYWNFIPTGIICAGLRSINTGTCHGDSGGPLVWKGKQYGITSYGGAHCGIGNPTVFTDVFYYKEWIKSTMNKFQNTP